MSNMSNKNIKQLHEEIQSKLEEVEDINELNERELKGQIKEFFELTVFKLLVDDSFLAHLLMQIKRKITYQLPAPAACNLVGSHYNIMINPLFLFNFNLFEIEAIIKHELYHIVNIHPVRGKKLHKQYDHTTVNVGMDLAINQYIDNLPKEAMNLEEFRKKGLDLDARESSEYYIKKLAEEEKNNKDLKEMMDKLRGQNHDGSGSGGGNKSPESVAGGSGSSGMGEEEGEEQEGQGGSGGGKGDEMSEEEKRKQGISNHDAWDESKAEGDESLAKDVAKKITQQAQNKSRGKLPGGMEEAIHKLNKKPVISWQKELKRMLGSLKIPYKKTMLRRNRRQRNRYDLPGRMKKRAVRVCAAIDTSGSMSQTEVEWAFNEIMDILNSVNDKLYVIECDMQINRIYPIERSSDVKSISGRGGTAFTPVFKHLKEEKEPKCDVLVYFTDGWGESSIPDEYLRNKNYHIIWVLTENKENLSVEKPHGVVKELKMSENM
jgi:predicted metal-dependent peptidase